MSDRLTLRGMGGWARRHGVPSTVISHERLDRLLEQFLLPQPLARAGRRRREPPDGRELRHRRLHHRLRRARSSTGSAPPNVRRVPLGVDLRDVPPCRRDPAVRGRPRRRGAGALLVHCGRLSPEKHVERSVDTVAELTESGRRVRLVDRRRRPARRGPRTPGRRPARHLPRVSCPADRTSPPCWPPPTSRWRPVRTRRSASPPWRPSPPAPPWSSPRPPRCGSSSPPGCGAAVSDHAPAFASAVESLLAEPEDRPPRGGPCAGRGVPLARRR